MTITITTLIDQLKIHAPLGVEVPREDDNQVSTTTITRWANDAAQKINERRGKTTLKETLITLIADTTDYALPSDCRYIEDLQRRHATVQNSEILGIPTQRYSFGLGPFGVLPTGQEISPALDNINRQRLAITEREDDHELFSGKIRMLFPIEAGEIVKVRYHAIDTDFAEVGDDRLSIILDYLMWQNLDWWIGKNGTTIAQDGDSFGRDTTSTLFRRKIELEDRWNTALQSIGPEAN